ncbi:hypothetical protein [Propioniciclava soli]|nr:hypothetical protein [Propioniciclava soli]
MPSHAVNLFVAEPAPADLDAARRYRDRLQPLAAPAGPVASPGEKLSP